MTYVMLRHHYDSILHPAWANAYELRLEVHVDGLEGRMFDTFVDQLAAGLQRRMNNPAHPRTVNWQDFMNHVAHPQYLRDEDQELYLNVDAITGNFEDEGVHPVLIERMNMLLGTMARRG